MLRFSPILLALIYGLVMYKFSAWRTAKTLDRQSVTLMDPALGHARRRMIDFSGQNAVRAALGMVLGRFIPWIGPWIAGLVANLLMARLSRGDEYEADEYAAALMVKSDLGTEAQKTLFLKLEELTGQIGSLPAWLMSHPKTSDRITAIEALEKKWGID
jgi:putative metalloprotease